MSAVQTFLLILAVTTLLYHVALSVEFFLAGRLITRLTPDSPMENGILPRVSVVIAARNEEKDIEHALQSVLALDYPDLEIVAVDDRSTDSTGAILEQLGSRNPKLKVIHIGTLPEGWMGKNHALHRAAENASGEFILFTDADVIMHPSTLRIAVTYMLERRLDHLAAGPRIPSRSVVLSMFFAAFAFFFSLYSRGWRAADPRRKEHVGIGAFNLVRAATYRAVGGHSRIRMRPDDDMMLGKILKMHGGRQELAGAHQLIEVEWYSSVPALVDGLMKNSFSGLHYRMSLVIAATIVQFFLSVWPFIALAVTSGAVLTLNLATAILLILLVGIVARHSGFSFWHAFGYPFATIFFFFIIWKASLRTLREGGVRWRGTFYPLEQLRANKV
jgi:cellulose synthase/poly-beta-1,6-N-acetylglucosamine synthase-like glycosyltransferase